MRIIETKVYTFDELNDAAKERARERYREGALDYDWWDFLYKDAGRIGLEITGFDLGGRKHIDGKLTRSVKDVCQAIMQDHGKACDTYNLAAKWIALSEDEQEEKEDEFREALLEEYLILLGHECEYLLSDECVDESIRCNGYTFTENGKREG